MTTLTHTAVKIVGLAFLALQLTACGGQGWFKDANFRQYEQDNSTYAEVTALLETKDIMLPSLEFPVYDPKNSTIVLGTVALRTGIVPGQSELALNLNVSRLIKLPPHTIDPTLPNGARIPVSGFNIEKLMTFPVGQAGSKVYVALDLENKTALMGTALVIEALNVGRDGNLFLPFSTGGLRGVAGVFLGQQPKQNGFAIFADAGGLISGLGMNSIHQKSIAPVTQFVPASLDEKSMTRLQMRLYKLNSKKVRVDIK